MPMSDSPKYVLYIFNKQMNLSQTENVLRKSLQRPLCVTTSQCRWATEFESYWNIGSYVVLLIKYN